MRTKKFFKSHREACYFKNQLVTRKSALIFPVYRCYHINYSPTIGYYVFYDIIERRICGYKYSLINF